MATIVNKTYLLQEGITPVSQIYGRAELRLTIKQFPEENYSIVVPELYAYIENRGTATTNVRVTGSGQNYWDLKYRKVFKGTSLRDWEIENEDAGDYCLQWTNTTGEMFSKNLAPGASYEQRLSYIAEKDCDPVYHTINGELELQFAITKVRIYDLNNVSNDSIVLPSVTSVAPLKLPSIQRALVPLTASDFTDEENPSFTYNLISTTGWGLTLRRNYWDASKRTSYDKYAHICKDNVTSLQAAISLDGETIDIPYREIPMDGSSYTFELTEAQRELLRQKAQGAPTVPVYYLTKIVRDTDVYNVILPDTLEVKNYSNAATSKWGETVDLADMQSTLIYKVQRNFTVDGCNPSINPTVKETKEEIIALTGSEDTLVRYESMAEFAINATASKNAEIVSQSVTCGSKTVEGLPYGVIDDVESGLFLFKATDSRNLTVEKAVQKNFIEYVKPTCYQKVAIQFVNDSTTAKIALNVNGNYYNGSFGAVDNTFLLEIRYTQPDGSMGAWTPVTEFQPTFNGTSYSVDIEIFTSNYELTYVFQSRVTDKLNYVQSAEYAVKIAPIFDWSETDFNFNVPIKMNGKTVLRHNETAKNTVLSASGGHIYIRPGGADDTSGEIMIKPDGDVVFGGEVEVNSAATFNGDVNLNGTVKVDGVDLNELLQPEEEDVPVPADYVVETGTEAMGTNGTWYWTKWASGRAECYGRRNFGSMAITTSAGNIYRSTEQSQALPSGLFIDVPDLINISVITNDYTSTQTAYRYCWIAHGNTDATTATNTGTFYVMRSSSNTIPVSHLTFDVKGRWK